MKRPASSKNDGSKSKRRKVSNAVPKPKVTANKPTTRKEKAYDRTYVPIPNVESDVSDIGDDDVEFFQENAQAGSFLHSLDQKGIARSKKETQRLHQFYKPARPQKQADDLPSLNSDDDEASMDDDSSLRDGYSSSASSSKPVGFESESDVEQPYERIPRVRSPSPRARDTKQIPRLPIKMSNGVVQQTGVRVVGNNATSDDGKDSTEIEEDEWQPEAPRVEDVTTGARFGRPAVVDILRISSRKLRIQSAKEQIASLCQEIIADPENNLALLRRLATFSLRQVTSPSYPKPVENDVIVRKLALLSQMTIFKDIAPGYRIRALTEKEKSEKVSQMVQRTRDFEQGLVTVYQSYLRSLDDELKAKSELSPVALQCMCTLLTELVHFNFRANIMGAVVRQLSRKSWDASSDLCHNAIVTVFRSDETGEASLELVRLLNRMVKERHFNVHGNVLASLMHLRLKSELHVRASDTKAEKDDTDKYDKKGKGKNKKEPHLSKKQRKNRKEQKVIEKELREADAEVDKEERTRTHTETLKLLFVLYFTILKSPRQTPLLAPALRGISRFSHLVNVDFFRDLLKVLQEHVSRGEPEEEEEEEENEDDRKDDQRKLGYRLQCIITAFELLSGQGEAIMIDLEDFTTQLYKLIPVLASCRALESPMVGTLGPSQTLSLSSMMLRALKLALSHHATQEVSASHTSPTRTAAFTKRLLTACLSFPPSTSQQTLAFVRSLVARDPRLDTLFSTEERCSNGRYRPDLDDPQLSCPWSTSAWEVVLLCQRHWDSSVRDEAVRLADHVRA